MFTEPLSGWREAVARSRRTKVDWAIEMANLLEGRYAACAKAILVCDNLNTHTKGAFYEVFEPAQARELVRRIEFCYTPKHGSWLNIAENELSSLTRQCIHGRRIGDSSSLQSEIAFHAHNKARRERLATKFKVPDDRSSWCLKRQVHNVNHLFVDRAHRK